MHECRKRRCSLDTGVAGFQHARRGCQWKAHLRGSLLNQQNRRAGLIEFQDDTSKSCSTQNRARPMDGSSKHAFGLLISARSMASICCSPPESVPEIWRWRSSGAETARTPDPATRRILAWPGAYSNPISKVLARSSGGENAHGPWQSAVGVGMFYDFSSGMILFGIHVLSTLTVGFLFRWWGKI